MILTCSPEVEREAWQEIQALDGGARLRQWLALGVGLVVLQSSWDELAQRLHRHPPIWSRHVCPAQVCAPLEQAEVDVERLVEVAQALAPALDWQASFSVQTRLLGEGWPYTRYDVNNRLAHELIEQGLALNVQQPEQVLSVVLTPTQGYLGLSRAADNLSNWAGGAHRFKREVGQISRAEFKLLEAMELFDLRLFPGGLALDLGASPGGWTRVLRQHGMRVVAVDPGDLDARLVADEGVRFVRQTAQRYLQSSREQFDVLLNDMRMDAQESAQVMGAAARNLRAGGWALLTLKLPQQGMVQAAGQSLETLRQWYTVIAARQLFHNRNEITVALMHL